MKNVMVLKMVAVVLALSFAFPRPALAAGEFAPFDNLVDDLIAAIDQVVAETDMVVDMFGADSKVSRHLGKGKAALGEAKDILVKEEFPQNVKKAAGKIKKWTRPPRPAPRTCRPARWGRSTSGRSTPRSPST